MFHTHKTNKTANNERQVKAKVLSGFEIIN